MSGQPLQVVVAGLGYFSQFHLAAWQANPETEIAGLCDPDLSAAIRAGICAPCLDDLEALLRLVRADIIDIVAPPPAHANLIRTALAPGRMIICQKPFATSLEEARALTAEAKAQGCTLVIHENFRFQPWHRTIKAFLESGEMGQVWQARFALRPGDGRGETAYLNRQPAFQTMPRLLIHETGVHFIDLFRWLFGEIETVYADLARLNPAIAGEDAGQLLMTHASGVRSVFDGNRLSDHVTDNPRRTMGEMVIEGEGGTLSLDGMGRVAFRPFGADAMRDVPLVAPVSTDAFGGGCVGALIDHVVVAMRHGGQPENQAADYLPVMRATEAAYLSAAEGLRITL